LFTGRGSVAALQTLPMQRAFVVTGGKSMFENGTIAKIEALLAQNKVAVRIHSGVPINPAFSVVRDGIKAMREFSPDTVIGVGGGAAMDAAKAMAVFYEHDDVDVEAAFKSTLPQKRKAIQLICIPSTSGTAAEVTRFAVLTSSSDQLKLGAGSPALIPDVAILDAEITLSMPRHVAAETGIDALTHAIECFTNPAVEEFTSCLAAGATEGLFAHLAESVNRGEIAAREQVHYFQSMAGCAFSNTGTGMAHGIAHAFGGRYNLGHGLLNAVALPYVIRFNSGDAWARERYEYLARRIGVSDLALAVLELNRAIGIEKSFAAIGVPEKVFADDFEWLVENSLKGGTRANPRKPSADEMREVLRQIFAGSAL
jgi:alcohol dehydrogenase class IV